MTYKNKKATELINAKLIGIILLILVLLGTIFILMKPQYLDWIKNLPGYESQPDTNISVNLTDQEVLGCTLTAILGNEDLSHWYNFGLDRRSLSVYRIGKTQAENIPLVVEIRSGESVYLIKTINSDILVGQIARGKLTINPDLINDYPNSEIKTFVSLSDLKLLNGSILESSTKLCKTSS
jgi:hypothetical protein